MLLPDDSVIAFGGASADEVINPGTGIPIRTPERFDPVTETWEPMVDQAKARTYHNTAILLPDGRVLVGGHAPISTAYLDNTQLPAGTSPPERDPSFEIFSPPYMFSDARPGMGRLEDPFAYGQTVTVGSDDAGELDSVVLVRNPTLTHLIDGDQRSVVLPIQSRGDGTVEVTMPGPEVLPPGQYMAFARTKDAEGNLIPSESRQVEVGQDPAAPDQPVEEPVPTDPPTTPPTEPGEPPASEDPGQTSDAFTRVAGADRIATAAEVARDGFDTAETVIVARSDDYPDALAGAPLATTLDAPLLLTDSTELSGATAAVIVEGLPDDLKVRRVAVSRFP